MASVVVVVLSHPSQPWRPTFRFHFFSLNPPPSFFFHSRRSFSPAYRRWDSNAETVRSQRFGFGFKRKSDEEEDDDDEYEGKDYYRTKGKRRRSWSNDMDDGSGGILEDAIDAFWIFKVQTLLVVPFFFLISFLSIVWFRIVDKLLAFFLFCFYLIIE